MKFSELEIVVGVILGIILIAVLVNFFWVNTEDIVFCGDGICQQNEIGSCKLDCSWCGDGYCQGNESCDTCQQDCGNCKAAAFCGDDICNIGECESGCSRDCSSLQCENGICEPQMNENCINTPNDCKCTSNEICSENLKKCIKITCGDNICESDETSLNCPNDCKEGYKEILSDTNKDFPIIFIHGHSVSETEGYKPTTLEEFQNKLTNEGYENKGYLLPSDYPPKLTKGLWADRKVSVITTYYTNSYTTYGAGVVASADNQHISVYAQRLHNVIETLKHNTGKNKVIIIAHSMGGLVSREYIREYGSDSVDKLIMLGTPNHGTYGNIADFCGTRIATIIVEGTIEGTRNPTPECDDMKAGSAFLNNLNSDETPGDTKYLTITGLKTSENSCPNGEKWDDVVCSSSVKLNGAENFMYPVSSSYAGNLHRDLVYPSKVPEVYGKIVSFIKQ